MRYAMAKVAAKILSGEENNTRKWKCVEDLAPNEEGAPKTLRQIGKSKIMRAFFYFMLCFDDFFLSFRTIHAELCGLCQYFCRRFRIAIF